MPLMRPELHHIIDSLLPRAGSRPELGQFYDMLRDYPARGGKGLRSELLLASARAHGGSPESEGARTLAAALELFQNWVLIHDDIADDSEERRGQPALHRLHGVPLALNAGDALHVYMWELVLRAGVPGAAEHFLGMVHRTAEGQHLDLSWTAENRWDLLEADYLQMVELKTAHYTVVAPLSLGALAAGQTPSPHFVAAGLKLGAAFQIRDDVLNFSHSGAYGKERGGDLWEGKRTLIALAWLQEATSEQRGAFLEQMTRPRADKDPAAMAELTETLASSAALLRAQEKAEALAREGLELLQSALAPLPDQQAATKMLALLRGVVNRSS